MKEEYSVKQVFLTIISKQISKTSNSIYSKLCLQTPRPFFHPPPQFTNFVTLCNCSFSLPRMPILYRFRSIRNCFKQNYRLKFEKESINMYKTSFSNLLA